MDDDYEFSNALHDNYYIYKEDTANEVALNIKRQAY